MKINLWTYAILIVVQGLLYNILWAYFFIITGNSWIFLVVIILWLLDVKKNGRESCNG